MKIDVERLMNWRFEEAVQAYSERDTMLYGLGLGLGWDFMDENQLRYVIERGLRPFPTMATVLGISGTAGNVPDSGIVRHMTVNGETALTIHNPLPSQGTVRGKTRILGVIDKGEGRGAVIYHERLVADAETGTPYATIHTTIFARGNGGFGGPAGPVRPAHPIPERSPDATVELPTFPNSALIYRLSGDYNPLHSDPGYAKKAGYDRPILHGLCTFGVSGHAIVKAICGYDETKLRSIEGRFSAPIYPGETLTVEIWREGAEVSFRSWVKARNAKVLDNGKAVVGE